MVHSENEVLEAFAGCRVHGLRLLLVAFCPNHNFITSAHLHSNRELAARIGRIMPLEFFLTGPADMKSGTRESQALLCEDGAAHQEIVRMLAITLGPGRRGLAGRVGLLSGLRWRRGLLRAHSSVTRNQSVSKQQRV